MNGYNATAYKLNAEGKVASVEAVELDADGHVVRACGFWSAWNGTDRFEEMWRGSFFSFVADVRIVRDGAQGYRDRLHGLSLPPAYVA